jgi:hypothetical protein
MKKISVLILSIFFLISFNSAFSQEPCKVLKPEIAGKYEGGCKNGLANGKGVSQGTDKYDGRFKNGLPDGSGKYTWSTGEIYDGGWKEGKKEGTGKFYYKKDGADSTLTGIWKNDAFYKKIVPNPYTVLRQESVKRYSVRRVGDGNKIIFTITQNGNSSISMTNLNFSPTSGSTYRLGQNHGFENIDFPFECKVTFSVPNAFQSADINVDFEIKITEPGSWEVDINI